MHRREEGEVLLSACVLLAGVVVAAVVTAQVARVSALRTALQTAADGAALAAAQVVRDSLPGSDPPRWACDGAPPDALRRAAGAVTAGNAADLVEVRADGCEVTAVVAAAGAGARLGAGPVLRARARARVEPGTWPGAGPLERIAVPGAPLTRGTLLEALVAEADRIDRLRLPYVWGGGHQSSPAPPDGPFDCSGAVSRLLQAVGYPIPTLTSADFTRIGRPGPGLVTIWAYDGHVFVSIAGRGWGTGARPHGGAGWLPYATPYSERFVARHLPELEDPAVRDLGGLELGEVLAGGPGSPPTVRLVSTRR